MTTSEDEKISDLAARFVSQTDRSREDLLAESQILNLTLSTSQKVQLFDHLAQGYYAFCKECEKEIASPRKSDLVSSRLEHWENLLEIFYFFDDHSIRGTIHYCKRYLRK